MPQYRLTKKFSEECALIVTALPKNVDSVVDDWVMDIFMIGSKKIAMATHAKTLCTLLIPYNLTDSAIKVTEFLPQLFGQFLIKCGYSLLESTQAFQHLSEQPLEFCKTNDHSILGVMSDFKRCIKYQLESDFFYDADWNDLEIFLSETPIKLKTIGFTTPRELLDGLLRKPELIH